MKVNEIFYSLQGEGHYTGTPAVFVRLSGCNMQCDFCDTDHLPHSDMTVDEIATEVGRYPSGHVVITGGEPTLQLSAQLLNRLHAGGHYIQIETNGTIDPGPAILDAIDWVTCSPKYGVVPVIPRIDELKVIFDRDHIDHITALEHVEARYHYMQPCDRADAAYNTDNTARCIDYILNHPKWRLSLQTHKLLDIR